MSTAKIVVSKVGTDVFVENDLLKNFDSSSLTHKIYKNDTSSITLLASGALAQVTIPHGLGYAPFFQVFAEIPGLGWITCPCICGLYQYTVASGYVPQIDAAIDSTNLYIRGYGMFGSTIPSNLKINLRYIIFTDKI